MIFSDLEVGDIVEIDDQNFIMVNFIKGVRYTVYSILQASILYENHRNWRTIFFRQVAGQEQILLMDGMIWMFLCMA